ncbi:hypothetical protein J6590_029639 [Homalodisca vitripennis]|nr:hypothetical protein J6590_029639 [Homalodisca vitripennis]
MKAKGAAGHRYRTPEGHKSPGLGAQGQSIYRELGAVTWTPAVAKSRDRATHPSSLLGPARGVEGGVPIPYFLIDVLKRGQLLTNTTSIPGVDRTTECCGAVSSECSGDYLGRVTFLTALAGQAGRLLEACYVINGVADSYNAAQRTISFSNLLLTNTNSSTQTIISTPLPRASNLSLLCADKEWRMPALYARLAPSPGYPQLTVLFAWVSDLALQTN